MWCVGFSRCSLIVFGLFGHCLATFPTYWNFWVATIENLVCAFWVKDCRFMPVRFIHDGGLASWYGKVWATWMRGIGEIGPLRAPVFASISNRILYDHKKFVW